MQIQKEQKKNAGKIRYFLKREGGYNMQVIAIIIFVRDILKNMEV